MYLGSWAGRGGDEEAGERKTKARRAEERRDRYGRVGLYRWQLYLWQQRRSSAQDAHFLSVRERGDLHGKSERTSERGRLEKKTNKQRAARAVDSFHRHAGKRRPHWLHTHSKVCTLSREPETACGITKPQQEDADAARCVVDERVRNLPHLWASADATAHGATGMAICRARARAREREHGFSRTDEPCQFFSFKK